MFFNWGRLLLLLMIVVLQIAGDFSPTTSFKIHVQIFTSWTLMSVVTVLFTVSIIYDYFQKNRRPVIV